MEWINLIGQKHPALRRVLLAAMTNSDKSYLAYMAVRILEMRRILKPTGSIYLHCDPTMSHYLKLVMDAIFGKKNFRNEIVWCYSGGGVPGKDFPRKHDVLLRYGKSERVVFNAERKPYKENTQAVGKHSTLSGGAYICVANKNALYGEQGGNCAGCDTHFEKQHFEVDHIIATGKGGTDHISNPQLLNPCNYCI